MWGKRAWGKESVALSHRRARRLDCIDTPVSGTDSGTAACGAVAFLADSMIEQENCRCRQSARDRLCHDDARLSLEVCAEFIALWRRLPPFLHLECRDHAAQRMRLFRQ